MPAKGILLTGSVVAVAAALVATAGVAGRGPSGLLLASAATHRPRRHGGLEGAQLISRRTLKLIAIGYVVKTVVFGAAWLVVPDLPQRAMDTARQAWVWAAGSAAPAQPHRAPAAPGPVANP